MKAFPEVAGASIPASVRGHMKDKISKTLHSKSGQKKRCPHMRQQTGMGSIPQNWNLLFIAILGLGFLPFCHKRQLRGDSKWRRGKVGLVRDSRIKVTFAS